MIVHAPGNLEIFALVSLGETIATAPADTDYDDDDDDE